MIRIAVHERVDLAALAANWRDLESRSACPFFLSWTWTGCLIEERFPNPILVEASEDGRIVALALFNRRRRWGLPVLWLHESGSAALDSPYIEQNGVLTEAGREAELTPLCLQAVARRWHVVMSAVDATTHDAARGLPGIVRVQRSQASPCVDLTRLRAAGTTYRASLTANTRQQIARSMRWYAAEAGVAAPMPNVAQAGTVEEAWAMLDHLAALHQETWISRGSPGSFAQPFFCRFHRTLIERGLALGQIKLQRFAFSDHIVGYLYGFLFRNRLLAYQSGFRYHPDVSAARPGLVAHAAAIGWAMGQGMDVYDFLAGKDRYKQSLSNTEHAVWWIEAGPWWWPVLWLHSFADTVRTIRSRT